MGGQSIDADEGLHQAMGLWRGYGVEYALDNQPRSARNFLLLYDLGQNNEPVWIGNNSQQPSRQWRGHITEVMIYDRNLSRSEQQAIFAHLRAKWNLP